MAGNSGGPWGGGGGSGGGGNRGNGNDNRGGRRPGEGGGQQIPEIDEIVRKGQEQLRVLMGGRGGRSGGSGGDGEGPSFGRGSFIVGGIALLALWAYVRRPLLLWGLGSPFRPRAQNGLSLHRPESTK